MNKKNEPVIKSTTTEIQKDTTSKVEKVVVKTPENSIYKASERLNIVLFGQKLKYLDFTTTSNKIPECAAIFDFKELIKVRAFQEPRFNKNYISNHIDNYVYFIFEYPSEEIAQKILRQYAKDSEIMGKVDIGEIPLETLSERQKQICYNSKHGGIIFNRKQNIIFVKESCSEPNTKVPMQWSTYEKVFFNSFAHNIKDSIVATGCGFRDWYMYTRK